MESYIETVLSDWIYQPHIMEKVNHKTFLEEGPIVLNKLAHEGLTLPKLLKALGEFFFTEVSLMNLLISNM